MTKLRWLADHEPDSAARVAAVALPARLADLAAERGAAPSTPSSPTGRTPRAPGYFDTARGDYRRDLLARALRRDDVEAIVLPRVLGPGTGGGGTGPSRHVVWGPAPGTTPPPRSAWAWRRATSRSRSGTSGVVSPSPRGPVADPSGLVSGFADATGAFLPLACTLNGSRVLDAAARLLGVDHAGLSDLALARRARRRRADPRALPRGRAHPEPARRHRLPARPDPGVH